MMPHDTDGFPPIPSEFLNSDTGAPHSHCLMCSADLMSENQPYLIEKAVRHYPTVDLTTVAFEFAVCAGCAAKTEQQLSTSTRMQLQQYFHQHFRSDLRPDWDPQMQTPFIIEEWIGQCAVKELPREGMTEYSIYARCIGDRIIPDTVPYMLSGQAQDELMQLFSNESIGFMDGFTDRYFSGPPEWKELFRGRPVLV